MNDVARQPEDPAAKTSHATRNAALWFALLAGPMAWALDLDASYVLVWPAIWAQDKTALLVVTVLTLALTAAGAFVGWRQLRRLPASEAGARFAAVMGVGVCAFAALIIVAQAFSKVGHRLGD